MTNLIPSSIALVALILAGERYIFPVPLIEIPTRPMRIRQNENNNYARFVLLAVVIVSDTT